MKRTMRALALLCLPTLFACANDETGVTAPDVQDVVVVESLDMRANRLDATLGNAYTCRIQERRNGQFLQFDVRIPAPVQGDDTAMNRVQFLRWNGVSRSPVARMDCVVPRSKAATLLLMEWFLSPAGREIGMRDRRAPTPTPATASLAATTGASNGTAALSIALQGSADASGWWGPITCWHDSFHDTLDCDGAYCTTTGGLSRVSGEDGTLMSSPRTANLSAPEALEVAATLHPEGLYTCDNGCVIQADGNGWLAYECPEGEPEDPPPTGGGTPGVPALTAAEENAQLCAVLDEEFAILADAAGEGVETADPFLLVDALSIAADVFDWAQEGYTCEGFERILSGVALSALPGPTHPGLVARGARVPLIRDALARGRVKHSEFAEFMRSEGHRAEVLIEGVIENASGRGRLDALEIVPSTMRIRVHELKPEGARGSLVADRQLDRYIAAMSRDGRIVGESAVNIRALLDQGYPFEKVFPTYSPF